MFSLQRSFSVNPAVLTSGHPYPFHPLAQSRYCAVHRVSRNWPALDQFRAGRGRLCGPYAPIACPLLAGARYSTRGCRPVEEMDRPPAGQSPAPQIPRTPPVGAKRRVVEFVSLGRSRWRDVDIQGQYLRQPRAHDPKQHCRNSAWDDSGRRGYSFQRSCIGCWMRSVALPVLPEVLHRTKEAVRHRLANMLNNIPAPDLQSALFNLPSLPHLVHAACMGAQNSYSTSSTLPNDSGSRSSSFRSNPYPYPINQLQPSTTEERYHAAQIALDAMRRAQDAEVKSKQELKQKSRQLATLRQKEKEVIGMSYHYQKREQELVAALAAAKQRSSAELDEMRTAVHALKRQAAAAQQETQHTVAQIQSSQEGMYQF
ncbi:hypothetical protein B0H14DRAFT_1011744 [Mycena olivaceomarginata]|nr:hypothetical protein B0H14DRAFT_1011744 [Mycena olivaceomarginata]